VAKSWLEIKPVRYNIQIHSIPPFQKKFLHEVEREARKYFCHENFDVTHMLDAVDINLTLQISKMDGS